MTQPLQQHPDAEGRLREMLLAGANAAGGWGYYQGKTSRLESTCWVLIALDATSPASDTGESKHPQFLLHSQQASGWLVEDPRLPVNVGFNALAAFTWQAIPALAPPEARGRLMTALTAMKGIRADPVPGSDQDNTLQGWPWMDTMFSWVEPTSWALLALKKARRTGSANATIDGRISEGERVLFNRACRAGGWNYGNAQVLNQDLPPFVPTTAVALLALQDRTTEQAVVRGLGFLETHATNERSATALGLALIALSVHGRPTKTVETALRDVAASETPSGNLAGQATALVALSSRGRDLFRL